MFDTAPNEGNTRISSPQDFIGTDRRESVEEVGRTAKATTESSVLSESRNRRQLELKLLHTYNTQTCHTLHNDEVSSSAWIYEAPSLALENESLLSALFAFTALHMIELDPSNETEMRTVHHRYWHAALLAHAQELRELSPSNYDAACITSTYIRLNASVMLRDRPLDPYTPPIEWYQVTRGAMQVFAVSYDWMSNSQDSIASRLTARMPFVFDEDAKFAASNRERFFYLSEEVGGDALEEHSEADRDAYEKTISYVGGICIEMDTGGPTLELSRRLLLLPYLVPARFADLLQAEQPRALVIIAHYFALVSRYSGYWWIGATGDREVHALAAVLPLEWQPLMRWPLEIVDGQTNEIYLGQQS